MTIDDFAVSLCLLVNAVVAIAFVRMMIRQRKFEKCLIRSRDRQLAALAALKNCDWDKCDLLMLAAQEELDRARELLQ